MESLAFLEAIGRAKTFRPLYVLHGDEAFLKRSAKAALRSAILGGEGEDFAFSSYSGDAADLAAVMDELRTIPFLSPRRLVVVEEADHFVTHYRSALEKLVPELPTTGVLVLDVKSWPATTRLAKLVPAAATIVCKAPQRFRLPQWCVAWCASCHDKKLTSEAARLLVELAGVDMGVLDQELSKLAAYVGKNATIDAPDVEAIVGGGYTADVFKIVDALALGQPDKALSILDETLARGDDPIRVLGALSAQLRRLARAAAFARQGRTPSAAVAEAGFPPFAQQSALGQLRAMGEQRLYDLLLELDLGLKGSSSLPPRTQLERFLIRLRPSPPAAKASTSGVK